MYRLYHLISHFIDLACFRHKGRGLNWSTRHAQMLLFITFATPLVFLFAQFNLVHFFLENKVLSIVWLLSGLYFYFDFKTATFIRTEVGVLLLCLSFYLLRLILSTILPETTPQAVITTTFVWQTLAVIWYIKSSRIKVEVARTA